ncbi:MAG: hypothetical protein RLZZ398_213 [Verrucomicrobiota bacterium]|jgi:hypothetical protein
MNDDTKSLIGASLRTMLVGMPSIPAGPNPFAMVAQGWSEYEGHKFKQRIQEFITAIHARLTSVEALQENHLGRLLDLEEQVALLEEVVAASSREPHKEKRQAFADFYVAAITGKLTDDSDSVRSLLQTLEALTPSDIKFLKHFNNRTGVCTGDQLSGTTTVDQWERVGGDPNADALWSVTLDPIIQKVTKLETRGLVIETRRPTTFQHSGDSGSWYNAFRRKAWRITDTGCQLLSAIFAN